MNRKRLAEILIFIAGIIIGATSMYLFKCLTLFGGRGCY